MDDADAAPAARQAMVEEPRQRGLGLTYAKAVQVECPLRLDHTALEIAKHAVLDARTAKLQKFSGLDCQISEVIHALIADGQVEGFRAALLAVRVGATIFDGLDVAHRLAKLALTFVVRVVVWVSHGDD